MLRMAVSALRGLVQTPMNGALRCRMHTSAQNLLAVPSTSRVFRAHPLARSCNKLPVTCLQRRFASRGTFRVAAAATAETTESETGQVETFQYQAEVDRLMDMIVHSLYSNREVFLRELISNASDALDKERFTKLTSASGPGTLEIRVKADPESHIIEIEDTGIGMTKDELLSSLGTIARSGTAKFMEAIKESQGDANLIGQFGVGFYSSFLVSDRVRVVTRAEGEDQAWVWESKAGAHQFTIKADDSQMPLERGTRVTLFLKEDAWEYADEKKLSGLIKQYSEFISFPIKLWASSQKSKEVVDLEATKKKQEEADRKAQEEGKGSADPVEPVNKTDYETVWGYEVQNSTKPLWLRNPKEVTREEYDGFFKTTFKEFLEPLAINHFNVEGTIEFTALLFVPGMAPFDQADLNKPSRNIRLYVKRVFISDEFDEDLMPRYLSFVKGIVDSSDLPLNVSREILQESRVVRVMKKQLVRRMLEMLYEVSKREDKKDYETLWDSFGKYIKMGVIEDTGNKIHLSRLLRFQSSNAPEGFTSLADYVSRMPEGQKEIYYMAGDSRAVCENSPFVEQLIARGREVLYLVEPIDEVVLANLQDYEEKKLVDVTREDLLMDDEQDKKKVEEAATKLKPLLDFIKNTLGDKVEKVVVSSRLADSPCALVTSKFGYSANMERIMKTQAMGDTRALEYMRGRRIMEINPDSNIITSLQSLASDSSNSREAKDLVTLMYETALITSGFTVESPKTFAKRIYDMIGLATGATSSGTESSSTSSAQSGSSNGSSAAKAEKKLEEVVPEVLESSEDPWRQ